MLESADKDIKATTIKISNELTENTVIVNEER